MDGAKQEILPPAVVTDHFGGGGGVTDGFAHNAGQAADEGVAVSQRLGVADDSPYVTPSAARQHQKAVLYLCDPFGDYVQSIPDQMQLQSMPAGRSCIIGQHNACQILASTCPTSFHSSDVKQLMLASICARFAGNEH